VGLFWKQWRILVLMDSPIFLTVIHIQFSINYHRFSTIFRPFWVFFRHFPSISDDFGCFSAQNPPFSYQKPPYFPPFPSISPAKWLPALQGFARHAGQRSLARGVFKYAATGVCGHFWGVLMGKMGVLSGF
jgi:hypothetical protein